MIIKWIDIAKHPANTDKACKLVSPARDPRSIYQAPQGFVATINGLAAEGFFPTQSDAQVALDQFEREAIMDCYQFGTVDHSVEMPRSSAVSPSEILG